MSKKVLVINLFGSPGSGKSTGAAIIFGLLKLSGCNVELVTEFAKDKVWEQNDEVFKNQAYIFGKQSFKMSRCRDKVDMIVTDCPLMLSAFYNHDETLGKEFNNVVQNVFESYNNKNFFLKRVKPYNPQGRIQTEKESDELVSEMTDFLDKRKINYSVYNGDINGYLEIVYDILNSFSYKVIKDGKKETEHFVAALSELIGTKIHPCDSRNGTNSLCQILNEMSKVWESEKGDKNE